MPPPSNRKPFPDKAHEDLAKWVEETVANSDDGFLLVDTLFSLLDAATAQIADLSARVAALEPAVFTDKP
jgi:hypothetical protein